MIRRIGVDQELIRLRFLDFLSLFLFHGKFFRFYRYIFCIFCDSLICGYFHVLSRGLFFRFFRDRFFRLFRRLFHGSLIFRLFRRCLFHGFLFFVHIFCNDSLFLCRVSCEAGGFGRHAGSCHTEDQQ